MGVWSKVSDFINELQTKVKVKNNTEQIDTLLNTLETDNILSQVLSPAIEQLKHDKETIKQSCDELADKVAERISSYQEQFIRMNGSVLTGLMADSVETESLGDGEAIVGNTAHSEEGFPYPITIEFGRGEVRPKNGKVLRWVQNGEVVFSKYSSPTSPRPFVEPSLEYITGDIDDFFETSIMSKIGE